MQIESIRTPGLGDATYILSHAGQAIVVDPQRDIDRFVGAAERMGAEVRFILETHVHNDYVSGGRTLAGETGATLVLPAASGAAYEFLPAFHLEDIPADGGLQIRPIHTPGHTPEHTSYLVIIDGQPVALFSGGSLLVGSAGRPDLLGIARARQLARLQYGSVQRLARLPDDVELFPTHGEGSFCTTTGAGRTTSTIGQERAESQVLAYPDEAAFIDGQLANLGPYPRYYAQMGPINALGPTPLPESTVNILTLDAVAQRPSGTMVIDARPRSEFAQGHIADALGIELTDDFGTWVGWLTPFNAPLILVLNPDQDIAEAVVQLGRIGYDRVVGVYHDMERWTREQRPTRSHATLDVAAFTAAIQRSPRPQVLDVRTPAEWQAGHIEGAVHKFVADLAESVPEELDRSREVFVACGSGRRASIAASLLLQRNVRPVALDEGGVPDVLAHVNADTVTAHV